MSQTEIVNLEDLVEQSHPYRKLLSLVDFHGLSKMIKGIKKNQEVGRSGYMVESCLKILVLQFMEDLSDREMERFIRENLSAKLFCGFGITDITPEELEALEIAKRHLKQYSYREVAIWLSKTTGRYISHMGLHKRIKVEQKRKKSAAIKRKLTQRLKEALSQIEKLEQGRVGSYSIRED